MDIVIQEGMTSSFTTDNCYCYFWFKWCELLLVFENMQFNDIQLPGSNEAVAMIVKLKSPLSDMSTPHGKAEHTRGRTLNRAGYTEVWARAPSI